MIAALLLAGAVVAVPVDTGCGAAAVNITSDARADIDFGGELVGRPPMTVNPGQVGTIGWTAPPGTVTHWEVRDFRTGQILAEGWHPMPPCISAPPRPDVVVDDGVVLGPAVRLERRRAAVWEFVLQMVRGMW